MFSSRYNKEEIFDNTEDQLMEAFTFGVAKRLLGVMISTDEDEQLMDTDFKKYLVNKEQGKKNKIQDKPSSINQIKGSWLSKLFKNSMVSTMKNLGGLVVIDREALKKNYKITGEKIGVVIKTKQKE